MTGPTPDVVVVGAGVVGAAVAYVLSGEGMRVTVLEAGFPGGGATGAGMGHVVVMDDSDAQLALTRYSRELVGRVMPRLPPRCEVERTGTLWIAEREDQLGTLRAKHAVYTASDVAAELLDASDVAAAEPALRKPLAGALRVPDDVVLYPPAFARWLLDEAVRAGARVRTGVQVTRIEPEAAIATDGAYPAGAIVNAAGAQAARLSPDLPIVPRKGHLVITQRHPGLCRHQLVELGYLDSAHTLTAESVAFNVQPRCTGQLLIGSSRELVGWDPSINRALVGRMLERAVAFLPGLARASAIRTWVGFRPATPDKLPLIGRMTDPGGEWIAAGHEGLGIATALGSARILADLMLGRPPAIDATPFVPTRAHAADAGAVG